MKKFLLYLLTICLLLTCLVPGSRCIVQAQVPHPMTYEKINPGSDVNVEIQTLAEVESFDCNDAADVPASECQVLVDLYESTNGAGWAKTTNWLTSTSIDDWFGITVTDGHVSIIELYGNNLVGEIPVSISQLPYLIELCLTNNQVSGVIPESISSITTLEKLSLDSNDLSGSIPESISTLPNLSKISLGHNHLTGSIPTSLGEIPVLQRLEIHDNEISGELPESLGQATNLLYLIIFFNPIEGKIPLSYTNLINVTDFYFFGTQLCEPTTPEFLAWKALVGDGWQGTSQICMDFHCFMPIIAR